MAANRLARVPTPPKLEGRQSALPATNIRVVGPPPTSGTRDSLNELFIQKGCETDAAMKALKDSDSDKHKDLCTKIREDGAFVEAGENDNLLVQKISSDPNALGVLGTASSRKMPTSFAQFRSTTWPRLRPRSLT